MIGDRKLLELPCDVIFATNIRRRIVREYFEGVFIFSFNENRLDPCPHVLMQGIFIDTVHLSR